MATLGLNPGDVRCMRAGIYSGTDLGNLRGTAEANIPVVNEGAVEFTGGVRFHDLSHSGINRPQGARYDLGAREQRE